MSTIPAADDVLKREVEVLPLPTVAEHLGLPITRVHQMLRDGQLLAVRRDRVLSVPADFLDDNGVVKHLAGTITVLKDGGYTVEDILRWLFTEDDSLPGTPVDALRSDRSREVKRRAQAMAF
ncbi:MULTISPECIES: Rv2175c family DNA-binding protein [unclassified Crossiella]|uniref:Rv2175c family DNA-binding protein n=1 Tax=unclassified Crossiella TaxID=2620835 RepID=UPI00207CE98C|nr:MULTISPECIES: Rv2175c family DNA-binding protein [unclassified Crossiella]MCO1581720.1 Rv2175c family DNA-binding protein [Crossiella sp. SN42]WHT21273.1 Rv2175c family DNA-binding protein [Crossiella sp. CA-258035]